MTRARADFTGHADPATARETAIQLQPDQLWSATGASERRQRTLLVEAIMRLPEIAGDAGYPGIQRSTLNLAAAFVAHLPLDKAVPRLSVDDEGDILMRWAAPDGGCALTFTQRLLHLTVRPGSNSEHVPPLAYLGGPIPRMILMHLPRIP